ncbi:MAG: hypothetical protein RL095_1732 [Verrucomicrobiota bacterium]
MLPQAVAPLVKAYAKRERVTVPRAAEELIAAGLRAKAQAAAAAESSTAQPR